MGVSITKVAVLIALSCFVSSWFTSLQLASNHHARSVSTLAPAELPAGDRAADSHSGFDGNRHLAHDSTALAAKKWDSYEEYLDNQKRKLRKTTEAGKLDGIVKVDFEMERLYSAELIPWLAEDMSGKHALCLAARLGGEVRAFHNAGANALGLDLNPGVENQWVVAGDFHHMQFHDSSFDYVFSNAFDHAFDLAAVGKEICRVLKKDGKFILDIGGVTPGEEAKMEVGNHESLFAAAMPQAVVEALEAGGPMKSVRQTHFSHIMWQSLTTVLICV